MELELLNNILDKLKQNRSVLTGPGDDCAVVKSGKDKLLLAVDQVTLGVHFTEDTAPELAGAKLVKRNLSDIAAMGGEPLWMLLTISNGDRELEWVRRFIMGAEECCETYDVPIVGGDTAKLTNSGFSASITVVGRADTPILRSGANAGDKIYVTGKIGNSFKSKHHLTFVPHLDEGRYLADFASAMMDISDGLLLDAKRMAQASGKDFFIDPSAIPLRDGAALPDALSDGEDYGLLFTSSQDFINLFREKFPATPVTEIGHVSSGTGVVRNLSNDQPFDMKKLGYEH